VGQGSKEVNYFPPHVAGQVQMASPLQAFRNEVACASDEHAISVLIELAKCYEHVRHIRLALEAKSLNFPMSF